MSSIGQKIKELRKKNNITQENLADLIGVTYKAVSKWECGITSPDISLIVPLTKALNVSADELFGIADEISDKKREKYENALKKYHHSNEINSSYWYAREALCEYPNDYKYMEWLASAEYQLAFDEISKNSKTCNIDFINEMTENSYRRYEIIIENCPDTELYRIAVIGKILVLRFTERIDEAEWSAEFEYPDSTINETEQILQLCNSGRELLKFLKNETEQENNI